MLTAFREYKGKSREEIGMLFLIPLYSFLKNNCIIFNYYIYGILMALQKLNRADL